MPTKGQGTTDDGARLFMAFFTWQLSNGISKLCDFLVVPGNNKVFCGKTVEKDVCSLF